MRMELSGGRFKLANRLNRKLNLSGHVPVHAAPLTETCQPLAAREISSGLRPRSGSIARLGGQRDDRPIKVAPIGRGRKSGAARTGRKARHRPAASRTDRVDALVSGQDAGSGRIVAS